MVKKRASSDGGQNASKRLRTGENNGENGSDSDMSGDRLSDSDGENNCSQNPGFRPQEPTVSCMLL